MSRYRSSSAQALMYCCARLTLSSCETPAGMYSASWDRNSLWSPTRATTSSPNSSAAESETRWTSWHADRARMATRRTHFLIIYKDNIISGETGFFPISCETEDVRIDQIRVYPLIADGGPSLGPPSAFYPHFCLWWSKWWTTISTELADIPYRHIPTVKVFLPKAMPPLQISRLKMSSME